MTSNNTFDWATYADATLAGMSYLIPVPFLDSVSENFFRNRIMRTIAAQRGRKLHPRADDIINEAQTTILSRVGGCLLWPFWFVVELLLKLSRKILYFLAVKKAIDALNYYWQRAYLIDHMVQQGHLDADRQMHELEMSADALRLVLAEHGKSPLTRLARQTLTSPRRLVQSVRRARKGEQDAEMEQTQRTMREAWSHYDDYFERLKQEYDVAYKLNQGVQTV